MLGWLALGLIVWLVIVVAVLALLTVAKRAEAIADADYRRYGHKIRNAGRMEVLRARPALDRVAQAVRQELAVDQVVIVARDRRQPLASVAIAAVGVGEGFVGRSLEPRESLAAAVALTGFAVIAPEQAPLDRSTAPTGGDSAAVPLAELDGAIAVARLGAGQRLTPDELRRLRAILRRLGVACADISEPPPPPRKRAGRPARLK